MVRRTLSPRSTGFRHRDVVHRSPFEQHEHLSASAVGTSTLPHARLVTAPEGWATSRTLRCSPNWGLARSTIAALNPWSFRQYSTGRTAAHALELLGGVPLPHGYPPAPSPGPRRMNAVSRSAFRLSPLAGADRPCPANRFNVRTTSRTYLSFGLSKISAHSGLGGARILVSGSSNQRYTFSATSPKRKRPGAVCDTGPWKWLRKDRVSPSWRRTGEHRIRPLIGAA